MTSRIFLAAGVVLAAALAGHAVAQTSSTTSSPPAHASTSKHTAAHKTVASGTAPKPGAKVGTATKGGKHVPVLAPRHAGPPRHATPATAAASKHPVLKPAVKTARKVKEAPPPAPAKPAATKKPPAPPAPPVDRSIGTNTGLHLPRYASLKSDDVNMRVGPAERYPVKWIYKRRELPVKIEQEFDIWRAVEDMDGEKGWVHQATLTGRRTFVITGTEDRTLRADASETADPVAVLKPGVVGRIKSCEAGKAWCQVQVQDYRGWLQRSDMWGVDADEVVTP